MPTMIGGAGTGDRLIIIYSPPERAETRTLPNTSAMPAISGGVAGASRRTSNENSVATSGSTKAQIEVRATPQRAMPRYQK